jgi:phenylalanyl-tRNA synthetase beta chain
MTISYKWLNDYLPVVLEPDRLSRILTSVGLEVEDFHKYEEVKGGLDGLVVGEVLGVEKHPNADKLTVTKVNVGNSEALQIVCGAPNVAAGQKVIVAKPGTTIHPINGEPVLMKIAKIRGVESNGMICAEDEIGLGTSHEGILLLNDNAKPGQPAAEYFNLYEDWIYEIGLTPNRMDAMSHRGVARDVCAYLSHQSSTEIKPKFPRTDIFRGGNISKPFKLTVENIEACQRYSGLLMTNIPIAPSPISMQQRLKAIGIRPINNIVDITNYIQHETGQPLHAFDADEIKGNEIVVKNLAEGTKFITLDEKERKLSAEDLMICDAEGPICIAGVFGGLHSGVTQKTKNIFLESAWFNPIDIRKTSFRHGLRTEAALRFEKGIDIGNTVNVLKRAALMIQEICGGQVASEIMDVYPHPKEKIQVAIKYHYLKKLSGKNYHPQTVENILRSLGFDIVKEGIDELIVAVPLHKPDIFLPADIVEEIIRIDGLDNIAIPQSITMTPATEETYTAEVFKEKIANYLVGLGFNEIMTNSITNEAYFSKGELKDSVKMLNSLSAELNIMRPSMLETGLEAIVYNLNRKNNNLKLFDFGKTYSASGSGSYHETEHLCLYVSGNVTEENWKHKPGKIDSYYLRGAAMNILRSLGIEADELRSFSNTRFSAGLQVKVQGSVMIEFGPVNTGVLNKFDIKQPVFFADFNWSALKVQAENRLISIKEISKFPSVNRDVAMIVPSELKYEEMEGTVQKIKLQYLEEMKLFDIFESEKLGEGKKSMAVSFTFLNPEKTLTDKEIDEWMNKIMTSFENDLKAEIRK